MAGTINPTESSPHRLYKSNTNRMIDGVCAGVAEYFNMDATLVRVLWVIFTLLTHGAGIIAYIVGMIIIPKNPSIGNVTLKNKKRTDYSIFWGILLIVFGVIFLVDRLDFFYFDFDIFYIIRRSFRIIWPLALIGFGGWLIYAHNREPDVVSETGSTEDATTNRGNRLTRSYSNRMIAGVCGGVAKYFNTDPTLVRILWVIGTLFSKGMGILAYIIIWIAVEEE